jgi:hypothetical protein
VVSKPDFLERMRAARAELNEAISGLSDAHMSQDIIAGEAWAVRDILAHIASWQIETLRSIERTEHGQDTGPLINESESEWDARRVAERRQLPLVDVMQEFHQAHDELLAALDRWPSDTVPLGPALVAHRPRSRTPGRHQRIPPASESGGKPVGIVSHNPCACAQEPLCT